MAGDYSGKEPKYRIDRRDIAHSPGGASAEVTPGGGAKTAAPLKRAPGSIKPPTAAGDGLFKAPGCV